MLYSLKTCMEENYFIFINLRHNLNQGLIMGLLLAEIFMGNIEKNY